MGLFSNGGRHARSKNTEEGQAGEYREALEDASADGVAEDDAEVEEAAADMVEALTDQSGKEDVPDMVSIDEDAPSSESEPEVEASGSEPSEAPQDSDDDPGEDMQDEPSSEKPKSKRRKKGKHAAGRFGKKARMEALAGAGTGAAVAGVAGKAAAAADGSAEADGPDAGSEDSCSGHVEPEGPDREMEADSAAEAEGADDASSEYGPVVPYDFSGISIKKKRNGLKVMGILSASLVALICIVYVAGIIVFMGRMYPNMQLGQFDVSLQSDAEVAQEIADTLDDYSLTVRAAGFEYRLDDEDLGVSIDSDSVARAVHAQYEPLKWPWYVIEGMQNGIDATDLLVVTYDKASFEPGLREAIDKYNETAEPPQNATITYDDKQGKFIVKKEVYGTMLDLEATMDAIDDAIRALEDTLKLTQEQTVQPEVYSTDERLVNSADLATGMTSADITLVMAGQEVRTITGADLSPFVAIDENLDVTFNDEALNAWCDELANGFNTAGAQRTYTRADGKVISVSGGVYGWEIDKDALKEALMEGIKSGQKTRVEVPLLGDAAVFTGPGERDWGPRYIDVDISEQHVRFYNEAGELFWETDCITGTPDGSHNTVEGVWTVNAKESPSKLIGYENGKKIYESYVTYWMPFEGNSIGLHDATWQPGFGGTMYRNGYGSHGCVNLSYAAAQELYGIIEVGDVVVVHS